MGKLLTIARNVLSAGGEYISINDLIANYPDGVTINGAFIRDYGEATATRPAKVPCFTLAEDSTKFFYAIAGDLAALFDRWYSNCNKDINELNQELRSENITIKIQRKALKGSRTYTKAWVVGAVEKPHVDEFEELVDAETGEILESNDAPF